VTALTGRLIESGYVTRERHPEDGRMRLLTVTAAGSEHLHEYIEPVHEPVDEALGELTEAERELLARVLDELAARREEAAAATPEPERVLLTDGYTRALLM
jgi:DNA-binding MarR family transcriptional regulator